MRRTKKIRGIRRKNLFLLLLILFILFFISFFMSFKYTPKNFSNNTLNNDNLLDPHSCKNDKDCVPATCCHAEECINKENAPKCKGVLCTAVCSGPLDCGKGYCGCVNGKCQVIKIK